MQHSMSKLCMHELHGNPEDRRYDAHAAVRKGIVMLRSVRRRELIGAAAFVFKSEGLSPQMLARTAMVGMRHIQLAKVVKQSMTAYSVRR